MEFVWLSIIEWADHYGESDTSVTVFKNEKDAMEEMHKQIDDEKQNDSIYNKDYTEEVYENSYCVYETGAFSENHWSIHIERAVIN